VLDAVRLHLNTTITTPENHIALPDREVIGRHIDRIVVTPKAIEVRLVEIQSGPSPHAEDHDIGQDRSGPTPNTLVLPWARQNFSAVKCILHAPSPAPNMTSEMRDSFLITIAKTRGWIDDLVSGRTASFAEIAAHEGKTERYIRLLASLTFTSPRIITALIEGAGPSDLSVAELAKALPLSWSEQERRFGLPGV